MTSKEQTVTVVGGGLAGCEAAWQLAVRGVPVRLLEAKPLEKSPAHKMDLLAELVCSNSLKSLDPGSPAGLLKAELHALGSFFLDCAYQCRVPAGMALAVDRKALAELATQRIQGHPNIQLERQVVRKLPEGPAIVATGPLTAGGLADALSEATGRPLYFYDAIAPIVDAGSIDWENAFMASRWDACADEQPPAPDPVEYGLAPSDITRGDYVNCPLDEAQYKTLVTELLEADKVPAHEFEEPRYFEGCLPVEVMAGRGMDVLRHGPMRPTGLRQPETGLRPHSVVQLRAENLHRTAYNLVGFQTRLTYPEQDRVFRLIPALRKAVFLRYGSIHRNTYLRAPDCLGPRLELKAHPGVRVAGLLCGVEGYAESAAMGLLTAVMLAADLGEFDLKPPPPETALGSLYHYLQRPRAEGEEFVPTNMNLSLMPPLSLPTGKRKPGKKQRRLLISQRGLAALREWKAAHPGAWPETGSLED